MTLYAPQLVSLLLLVLTIQNTLFPVLFEQQSSVFTGGALNMDIPLHMNLEYFCPYNSFCFRRRLNDVLVPPQILH